MVFSEGEIDQPVPVGEPEGRRDRAISQKIDGLLVRLKDINYQISSVSQSPGLKDDDYSPTAQTAYRFMTAKVEAEERQRLLEEREKLHRDLDILELEQNSVDTDEHTVD